MLDDGLLRRIAGHPRFRRRICRTGYGFEEGAVGVAKIITDTFQFDTAANGLGRLGLVAFDQRAEQGLPNFQRTLSYDTLARPITKITQLDLLNHTERTVYDAIGRPFKNFVEYTDPGVNFAYSEGTETIFTARGHTQKLCKTGDPSTTVNTCTQGAEQETRGSH